MRISKKLLFRTVCIFCLSACTHQSVIPASPSVGFATDVQPVIVGNCTQSGCHGGDSHLAPLLTYSDVRALVTPGNATGSNLYQRISNRGTSGIMPPSGPLSESDLQRIYLWIMQGAKNN